MSLPDQPARVTPLRETELVSDALIAVAERLPFGVAVFDREARYHYVNPALARINNLSAEEHIGLLPEEVVPLLARQVQDLHEKVMATGRAVPAAPILGPTSSSNHGTDPEWSVEAVPVLCSDNHTITGVTMSVFRSDGAPCDVSANYDSANLLGESSNRHETDQLKLHSLIREARSANQAKSAMISALSHDIRTPLTALIGLAEQIGAQPRSRNVPRAAHAIRESATLLLGIVDSLLQIGRLDRVETGAPNVPTELVAIAKRIQTVLRNKADTKGLSLQIKGPETVYAMGNESSLERIVMNLVSNAVRHTDSGQITVSVSSDGQRVVLHVDDQGQGIPEAERQRIFDPYVQLSSSRARKGGLGLGLAICAQLARHMNGKLAVSDSPEGGARFTLSLSAADPGIAEAKGPQSRSVVSLSRARPRILVVEDCESIRLLVEMMFSRVIDLTFVDRTDEALLRFREQAFDTALIDLDLGEADSGLNLVAQIRAALGDRHCRLIAFSATIIREESWFRERGFDGVLQKPFTRDDFLYAVGNPSASTAR